MDRNKKVILLAGPTSSGKSKLALKLATYLNKYLSAPAKRPELLKGAAEAEAETETDA